MSITGRGIMGVLSGINIIEMAGLGPVALLAANPRLVYGRMSKTPAGLG
jgi:hypothetical protein